MNYSLKELEGRIRDIATKNCGDYPSIETCDAWEMLYAIECNILGTNQACDDLHKAIIKLGDKLGMSKEELYDFLVEKKNEPKQVPN